MMNAELPKGWKIVRLGDFVKSEKGKKPKSLSALKTKQFSIPYVNIKAFEKNIIDEFTDGKGCVICEDDDFLMVWDGSRSGYVGKAIKGALGSTLVRLKFPGIHQDYAYYYLQSKYVEINTRAKGVGIPHVDPSLVWNYSFPIPPLPEQHRIVAKIDELFSDLDNGIANLKTAQQQLKTYRQAVLKWAFEGKNIHHILTLEECCSHVVDCLHSTAKFTPTGYYCIDTTCIENSKILFQQARFVDKETFEKRISRLKPQEGDILFAREGTVGTTVIVPKGIELCLGQRMMMFRLSSQIRPKYFSYYLQSPHFKSQYRPLITGTTAPHLNIRDIKQFIIIVGNLAIQDKIIQKIESRLNICDKMEETIEASLKQSESLRQSILKKAFEGKLC